MADDTVTVYDLELGFTNGERLYFTFRPDRGDVKVIEDKGLRFQLKISPTLEEEYIIERAALAAMKTTARLVPRSDLEPPTTA